MPVMGKKTVDHTQSVMVFQWFTTAPIISRWKRHDAQGKMDRGGCVQVQQQQHDI
jgi:hypothetical protein